METKALTAEELVRAISAEVIFMVKNFHEHLEEINALLFYNNSDHFVRRMMFFDFYPSYIKKFRDVVKQWVVYGSSTYHVLVNRDDVYNDPEAEKRFKKLCDLTNYDDVLSKINEIRAQALKENPILSYPTVSSAVRSTVLNQALKNNKTYTAYENAFDKLIKKVVSSIISFALETPTSDCSKIKAIVEKEKKKGES